MIRITAILIAVFAFVLPAQARHHHKHHHHVSVSRAVTCDRQGCHDGDIRSARHSERTVHWNEARGFNDPRPHAWCGWWLRHELGVADRAYNLARKWVGYGSNAGGPHVGAIAVWPHHVGLITGRTASGFIIKSGNDGHAVRERERSLRGVIAFRWPHGRTAMR